VHHQYIPELHLHPTTSQDGIKTEAATPLADAFVLGVWCV